MMNQRDHKAVRRVAGPADPAQEELEGSIMGEKLELAAEEGDDAVQGLVKRGLDEGV